MSLTEDQITAAGALHATLKQWRLTDDALRRLQDALPAFGPEESLLKVVAINALYGTNVFALVRAATHVQRVLAASDVATAGPELVESLANIPTTSGGRTRRYVSFASKFAHFFVSADRFPIYDSYAERMMVLHVGTSAGHDPARPYEAFVANLERLKRERGLRSTYRELDRKRASGSRRLAEIRPSVAAIFSRTTSAAGGVVHAGRARRRRAKLLAQDDALDGLVRGAAQLGRGAKAAEVTVRGDDVHAFSARLHDGALRCGSGVRSHRHHRRPEGASRSAQHGRGADLSWPRQRTFT